MKTVFHPFSITISDPTTDKRFPICKVPAGCGQAQVVAASAVHDTTLAEGDTDKIALTLQDGGSDATGTATVGATLDNAATGSHGAWTAETPRDFTITEVLLDEGDWLVLDYNESGTVATKNIHVSGWLVFGKR